jgi:hypothetical protein
MSVNDVRAAIKGLKLAHAALDAESRRTFPVNKAISWNRGGHTQQGFVRHNNGSRVRVENTITGKTYWISLYDMVGYVE